MTRHPYRASVLLLALALIVLSAVDAGAAGRKIFITKTDENFDGQAGVTFELYQDTNGNGQLDAGEPKVDTQVTDAAGKATFANDGGWATSFGRLSDGRCPVVVEFDGSEGREPSVPVTRTSPVEGRLRASRNPSALGTRHASHARALGLIAEPVVLVPLASISVHAQVQTGRVPGLPSLTERRCFLEGKWLASGVR